MGGGGGGVEGGLAFEFWLLPWTHAWVLTPWLLCTVLMGGVDGGGGGGSRFMTASSASSAPFGHIPAQWCTVATKHVFRHDANVLVVTKVLSRQNYVCRDKTFVATKMIFVAALASHTWLLSTVLVAGVEGEVGGGGAGRRAASSWVSVQHPWTHTGSLLVHDSHACEWVGGGGGGGGRVVGLGGVAGCWLPVQTYGSSA